MTNAPKPDPYKAHVIVLAVFFTVTLPGLMAGMIAVRHEPPPDVFAGAAEALGVTIRELHRGEAIYQRTCKACHGADAAGVPRLGKPLKNSAFVRTHSNAELVALVVDGRLPGDPENTTGVPMPARGAQGLTDDQIEDVVLYLRTLQDPDAPAVSLEPWMTRVVTPADDPATPLVEEPMLASADSRAASVDVAGADAGRREDDVRASADAAPPAVASSDLVADASGAGVPVVPAREASGSAAKPSVPGVVRETFVAACSSCHGPDGAGVPNLGKPLDTSQFVRSKTDEELIRFIKTGRPIWDAENTTGLDMPPKGGNPALTDEDLTNIVSYIRYLQSGS